MNASLTTVERACRAIRTCATAAHVMPDLAAGQVRATRQRRVWATTALLATLCGASPAAVTYAPLTITPGVGTTLAPNACDDLVHVIDQSGLSTGYTSGSTNFAVATSATHALGPCTTGSAIGGLPFAPLPAVITTWFGLGNNYLVDALAIWPTNGYPTGLGNIDFISVYADDDSIYNNASNEVLVGNFTSNSPITAMPVAAQVFTFAPVASEYFHLVAINNEGIVVRLGELAFRGAAVPEPGTLALLTVAGAALALTSRRRRWCSVRHCVEHKTASLAAWRRCKSSRCKRASLWFAPSQTAKSIGFLKFHTASNTALVKPGATVTPASAAAPPPPLGC